MQMKLLHDTAIGIGVECALDDSLLEYIELESAEPPLPAWEAFLLEYPAQSTATAWLIGNKLAEHVLSSREHGSSSRCNSVANIQQLDGFWCDLSMSSYPWNPGEPGPLGAQVGMGVPSNDRASFQSSALL